MLGPIRIKLSEIAADARALAALTGVPIIEAIGNAVEAQLDVERAKGSANMSKRRIEAEWALAELRLLPVVGPELSDRDFYNAEGLPK